MGANTFNWCTGLLIAGLLSACGSGSDSTLPQVIEADSPLLDDTANGSTEEAIESPTQDSNQNAVEGSTVINPGNLQNDGGNANTDSQQEQTNSESENSASEPPIANNQRVNFGAAKLLVDLVPNGDSYPAKFSRIGDKLYFWTTDTDPTFANCSSHWSSVVLDENMAFNLVATHPETGAVSMNKEMMTLGDFADYPNDACAGANGSVMNVFEHTWMTPQSATGEQQFAVHFDNYNLGPVQVWKTGGSESSTSQLETGGPNKEKTFFEVNKVFFVDDDGLSVSSSLSGDRRKLFEATDGYWYPGLVNRIAKSPARQATFEIAVGENRFQVWMYDLDTDEWVKKFNLKPNSNDYHHYETLLVHGDTLLSLGWTTLGKNALGFSSTDGEVRSFEILTDSAPTTIYTDTLRPNEGNKDELIYTTTDFSVTTVWSYREGRVETLFSISEPDLRDIRVIPGHDGRIYVAGTKQVQSSPETEVTVELWSYDRQTQQVVKLSKDDWYAIKHNLTALDEFYTFKYLNTPDGLLFLNLKEGSGRELWFTDGTVEGTRQLADINPGTGNSDPQELYHSGDAIYFSASDGIHGREPWMIPISR